MTAHELIEQFRQAYVAGERPDAAEYLKRAGDHDRDAVRIGIRMVLAEEPPPDPAPETLVMVQAMMRGEQPLIALRTAKGLTRDTVVHRLRELLLLGPDREQKVAEYYHELETGQLPLAGIRDRVFDALAAALDVARSSLMLKGPGPEARGAQYTAFARDAGAAGSLDAVSDMLSTPPAEPDEVDDLFTGGP